MDELPRERKQAAPAGGDQVTFDLLTRGSTAAEALFAGDGVAAHLEEALHILRRLGEVSGESDAAGRLVDWLDRHGGAFRWRRSGNPEESRLLAEDAVTLAKIGDIADFLLCHPEGGQHLLWTMFSILTTDEPSNLIDGDEIAFLLDDLFDVSRQISSETQTFWLVAIDRICTETAKQAKRLLDGKPDAEVASHWKSTPEALLEQMHTANLPLNQEARQAEHGPGGGGEERR